MNVDIINLSHNDLDGIGCNLVLRAKYPNKPMETFHVSYNDIQETLQVIDENLDHNTKVMFVTDLAFEEENFNKLLSIAEGNPWLKIVYIDHHPYEGARLALFEELKSLPNVAVIHSLKKSATMLTYEHLYKGNNENLKNIVTWIDAYDMWRELTDPKNFRLGWFLNSVYWEIKASGFKHMLVSNDFKVSKYFKELYADIVAKKKAYFQALKDAGMVIEDREINTLIAFSDKYKSDWQVDYEDFDFFILPYRTKGNNISIRISARIEDAKKYKDAIVQYVSQHPSVISAGGHDHAFGITIASDAPKEEQLTLIEGITDVIASIKG